MAGMRRPLEAEQAHAFEPRQADRFGQALAGCRLCHVRLENPHHLGSAAAPRRLPPWLGRAQPAVVQVANAARLQRCPKDALGKSRLARQRHGPHVKQRLHTRRKKNIEELVLDQPLVSNRENIRNQTRSPIVIQRSWLPTHKTTDDYFAVRRPIR